MIETVPSGTILHGHYRIERVLGSGGFGHVYLGVNLATNQQYALKEYLVTGASGEEQLKHEAAVLRQLHHPSIPAFQDAFIERGRYYIVLNYIEGNDLTDLIRITRQRNDIIPVSQIMRWILSICDAVLFLHSQQPPVIHRDIKPDNIRITSDGTAILVDMGNAKAAADGERTLFFIRHQGTPGYAPPEQYPGGSGTDTRSDVYALGGTLYFALTGQEPPSVSIRNQALQKGQPDLSTLQERLANNPPENNPEANAIQQFRLGVTKPGKPAPRHSRHIAQLGKLPSDLLNRLDRIIQKAMAIRPKDRYQSIADLARDLKKVANALPASPAPSTPPVPPRSFDPNSTQPDLSMLYEALQAAKGNINPNTNSTTPSPASAPSANSCPRCQAPLAPQAVFCSRCGTSLTSASSGNVQKLPMNIADVSARDTVIVKPQAPSTSNIAQSRSFTSGSSMTPASYNKAPEMLPRRNVTSTAIQTPSFSQGISNTPGGPSVGAGKPQAPSSGPPIKPMVTILIVVIIVVLLVAIVLLVISQAPHNHINGLHSGILWLGLKAQVLFHEQNVSFGLTSTTPFATTRIWQRNPGLPPAPGIS